ncbi:BZ3500_MvSof-1268-A1-R1_Chr9g10870 [Microbotryum saponariae]|uniref:BZ3500_MvSof-1268-A1-R1_Chr9g10870 protein n=1 Tax=Microbotryum saponariae TaxID=289078 RepID=A0A2X0L4E6_9BASI|nr:BZ3501_MvSof-1269-A2-R1_Chr9g10618 [Microbotryum saponariae]SDA00835.1 BZ3500_MvSof-1268-A1-R1_Chr9g10870 [Microbotryum saponariae]
MCDSATDGTRTWITQTPPADDATFLANLDAYLLPMSGDEIDLNLNSNAVTAAEQISVLEMAPAAVLGPTPKAGPAPASTAPARGSTRFGRDPPFANGVDVDTESDMLDWHPSYVTASTNDLSILSATESEPLLTHPRPDELWETTPRSVSFASSTSGSAMERAAPADWQDLIEPAMRRGGEDEGVFFCSSATTGFTVARRAAPRDAAQEGQTLQPAHGAGGLDLDRLNCECNIAPGPWPSSSLSSTAAFPSASLPRSASFRVSERSLHPQSHLRRSSYIEPGQYLQQQRKQQHWSSPSFFDLGAASSTEGTPELSPAASIASSASTGTPTAASATLYDYSPPPSPTAINRRRISLPGGTLTPNRNYSSASSVGPLGSPLTGRSRCAPLPPPRSSTRTSVHVSSAFAEMQDVYPQQQSPPSLPQQQYQHHSRNHDMLASSVTFTPSTPPRPSSFVAPSQMDALYRSASHDSNASSASLNSTTSYASAPPLLSQTHADLMMVESPPLLRTSSSNGEAQSNNNSPLGRRSSRRPAPIKIEASSKGRRQASRLTIEVPPKYLQQQPNRAHPLPGGLASPISPYPSCIEAGSTRPMTPTQQAASQREMEQLLGQLDNFLGPEGGGASQSMQQTMSSSPGRPIVPLRSPRGAPHLSIPSRMQNSLSPPASFGIASFEISGVTLNEEDLALLDDAEFHNQVNDNSKAYPASAPAWQTTFKLGPQPGQYGAPHPSQQVSYTSPPAQYTAPMGSHQMGWSHGAAYQYDNATNTTGGPPTPTTPRNQVPAMPTYQRREAVEPDSLSSPVRRRRSSDGLSAHPTYYTAAQHPNRMSYPYFEQQKQHQAPDYQTQRAPYTTQEQYSYGYAATSPSSVAGSSSSSSYPTHHHPSSMPRSMVALSDAFVQPASPVSPPKSPTKRARTSPPKSTVPLPPPSPVRPPLSSSISSPAVPTVPTKKSGGLPPMFINYSANDKKKLLGGVAPSGSSKKKREEAEAAARAAAATAAAAGQR